MFSLKSMFLVVFCLSATHQVNAENSQILAEIGGQKITLQNLEDRILSLQTQERDLEEFNMKEREGLLYEMVKLEVFAKEARSEGIDMDKEIQARIRGFVNYILSTEYIKREVYNKIEIDEKEVLRQFEENRLEYNTPEKINVSQIYLNATTYEEKIEARAKAEGLLERLKGGEDFATLAKEYTEDTFTRDAGGNMGYFSRGRLVPELEEPVFHLEKGEMSPVLESQGGIHIFKLIDRREGRLLEYDEARDRIVEKLKVDKQNRLYEALEERLFKKYAIKIYKERLTPTSYDNSPKEEKKVDIQGEITDITPASEEAKRHGRVCTLMVVGVEQDGSEDRVLVTVTDETRIFKQGDQKTGPEDLKEGKQVAVKFKGPVAMSYPAMAKAGEILILGQIGKERRQVDRKK